MALPRLKGSIAASLVVLIALGAYIGNDLTSAFGEKTLQWNDAGCELLGADTLRGGEDVALWKAGIVIVTAGDLKKTFSQGALKAENVGIFALDLAAWSAGAGAGLRQLVLHDYPDGEKLAGHGLYLSNRTQRLYVINHGDVALSQVEIFSVEGKSLSDLRLRHIGRIRSALFPQHCINDVVEGNSANEVFVSIWRTDEGVEGYNNSHDTNSLLRILTYRYITKNFGSMGVLRCTRPSDTDPWSCARTEAWGMPDANGLTISPDRTKLLVSSPLSTAIWQFDVARNGSLGVAGPRIPLPYPADNIEWDEETGRVFLGMIPCGLCEYPGRSAMELSAIPIASLGQKTPPKPVSLLRHDGSKLSQCSAGLQYGDTMVLGSPYHAGLLVCRGQTATS